MIAVAATMTIAALAAPAAPPAAGARLGTIEVPRIALHAPVVESTRAESLALGVGHYAGTGVPCSHRTIGLAGHRTTYGKPFARLNELRFGDRIVLVWTQRYSGRIAVNLRRTHVYRVEAMRIVPPWQVWPLRSTGAERLVLTACHPPTQDRYRIVVFAARAGSAV